MSPEYIPCKADIGVDPNETAIIFQHPETGEFISAIVPEYRVTTREELRPGGLVDGKLRVKIEKRRGKSAFIDIQPLEMVQGDPKQQVPLTFIETGEE